jgi:hypothetical protein
MKPSRLVTSGGVRRHTVRGMKKITKAALVGSAAAAAIAASVGVAAPAQASVFTMCPSGHAGVVGGNTSCAFAENVSRTFYASGGASVFVAYSPVTGDRYVMQCFGVRPAVFTDGSSLMSTNCYGGDGAEVVIW